MSFRIYLIAMAIAIMCSASALAQSMSRRMAEALCDSLPLSPAEGIWEYPADETSLLVLRSDEGKGKYRVSIVESVDCRLKPGMVVGELEASVDPRKFRLQLCSKLKGATPVNPIGCLATLSSDGAIMRIEAPKLKLTFTPSLMLPSLWSMLRAGLRMRYSNPLDKLPEGWRKSYPPVADEQQPFYY